MKPLCKESVDSCEAQNEGSADGHISGAVSGTWVVELVSRELLGAGAHRQLSTRVVLTRSADATEQGGVGSVALMNALPTGVYADKFELQRLASDGGEAVRIKGFLGRPADSFRLHRIEESQERP